jgi:hypothetical protein
MAATIADATPGKGRRSPPPADCQNCSPLCLVARPAALGFARLMRKTADLEGTMQEADKPARPALPLLILLAFASALGITVAIVLAGITMLLAAPAYADEGREAGLLLERPAGSAWADLVSALSEPHADGVTRVVEAYQNPYAEPLAGVYLHRLPPDAVVERLVLTLGDAAPHAALLTRRPGGVLVERTEEIGPGETLVVELEYRRRAARRLLALRD